MPTLEQQTRAQEALHACFGNKTEAARSLGVPRTTFRDWLDQADPFPVVPGKSILYDAQSGEEKLIWATGKGREAPTNEEVASQVLGALKSYKPPKPLKTALKAPHTESDLATVYPFADLHWGLRSWEPETGHNYDLQIARETLEPTISRLVSGSPASSQGVILGLGDLHHYDNFLSTTTKGTPQDVDGRYPKTLWAATQFILFSTDLALQKHHKVLIVILPGNHDAVSAVAIRLALALHYREHPRVEVCEDAMPIWWWEWGKVFLGATHGDKVKMAKLPGVMAQERPEAWGRTKFRHILTGHIHHQRMLEDAGATVESFQSPVAPDSFHVSHGYGAGRSMQAITYHKSEGEIMRQRVSIT